MKLLDNCKLQEFSRTILQRSTEMGCPLDTKFELYSCKMAGFMQKKTWKEMRQQGDPLQLQKMSPYEQLDHDQLDMFSPLIVIPATTANCHDNNVLLNPPNAIKCKKGYGGVCTSRNTCNSMPSAAFAKSLSPPTRPSDSAPGDGNTDSGGDYSDGNVVGGSVGSIMDNMAITRKDLWRLQTILDMAYDYEHDFQGLAPKYFCKEPSAQFARQKVGRILRQFLFHHYDGIAYDLWCELDDAIKLNECVAYSFHPDASCNPEFESLRTEWIFIHNRKLKRMMYVCMREISISDIGALPFYENDLSHVAINNGTLVATNGGVGVRSGSDSVDCQVRFRQAAVARF